VPTTSDSPIAASHALAPGFACFTTGRGLPNHKETTIAESAESIRALLPGEVVAIVFAGQIHGTTVTPIGCGTKGVVRMPSCDGLVTDKAGMALVIRTADCLPLVLVDAEARVCAGLHAGWRGCFENMLEAGVAASVALGARRERLRLWIGPCIRGSVYEVSPELGEDFQKRWGHLGMIVRQPASAPRPFLDLPELVALQAQAAGITSDRIVDSGLCTFSDARIFHSHRRQGTDRGHEFTVCGFLE